MEFASSIADNVLVRIASHASQEISLAWSAQLELTKLNNTLSAIKPVLEDAEKKQVRNPLITRWLGNLKDVCHDVDDVLDELDFQKLRLKVEVDNCGKIKAKLLCNNLESLPPNMKHMTALHTLVIDDCEKLQVMRSGEGPQGLRSLAIQNSSLEALPPWLIEDSADALQSIALVKCHNLTALPELINFTFLEQLRIEECSKLSALPQELHCLTELRGLTISECLELSKSCKRQLKGEEWSKMARQVKITLDADDEEDEDEGTPTID
ncbi:putative leucine-rich repeat domain, L domain-containing protein [Rosa chinensis]|uniref:Putative leucine-rich repeat domain, L domain-containing protein n=1 Tax=Rosa chinensis TaxID=74649 RepID=A0A2P6RRM0_ROSCH|nr:putative leucine-rich repeat domain, L domain-containing protein [Rosa chinensis]